MTVDVKPMAPTLGAEIHGLDLSQPLEAAEVAAIREALDRHQVVFFPDQKLTPAEHVAFGKSFGSLIDEHPPYLPVLEGHPEVIVLDGQKAGKADLWHTDITWFEKPPMGSILSAREMPEYGGDTLWANTQAAYEGLSSRMQRMLEGAVAVHDLMITIREVMRARVDGSRNPNADSDTPFPTRLPNARHPVVRTHPRSGRKGLFVNPGFTSHIEGIPLRESDAILGFLYEHMIQPEYTVRKRWRTGDVGFWDNTCTMHYAVADYDTAPRCIHRVTLTGETPV